MTDQTPDTPPQQPPMPGQRKAEAPPAPAPAPVTLAGALGEIVWLLTQSPVHRHLFLADLDWALMPPLLLSQFRTFRNGERIVGVALWATVSEEVDRRLASGVAKLRPDEWKSGERLWLMELVAPWGGQEAMLEELQGSVFKGKSVKMHTLEPDGRRGVRTVQG